MNEAFRNPRNPNEEMVEEVVVVGSDHPSVDEGEATIGARGGFLQVRRMLDSVLRPRLVSKGDKEPNWEETFLRLSQIYDIIVSKARIDGISSETDGSDGSFDAVIDPEEVIDLTQVFYELFPESKSTIGSGAIPSRSLRPNLLVVVNQRLADFLSEPSLRENFGKLVEGTRFNFPLYSTLSSLGIVEGKEETPTSKTTRSTYKNPNFVRFREAIRLASKSLSVEIGEEEARSILKEVIDSYLAYAQNVRSLPKP